jgi:hypothetical protein
VIGAAVIALPVAFLTSLLLGRLAPGLVARLRTGAVRPLLTAEHAAR